MEIITFGTIVITSVTSAIFGAAALLLGKEIRSLRGQLWSLEEQQHLEEQEYFKAMREAQSRIDFLERAQEMQRLNKTKEKTAKDYGG